MLNFVLFPILSSISLTKSEIVIPSDYPTKIGARCGPFQFDCDSKTRIPLCIPLGAVRDCHPDCPNMSDEWCGEGKILCDVGIGTKKCGKCVHPHEITFQCFDRKWQHLCDYQGTIKCARTMNCVFQKWLMDGKDDCGDGSDEDVCAQGLLNCGSFRYATSSSVIPSIESTTQKYQKPIIKERCDIGEFRCLNGECTEGFRVLDGREDCSDGSDENYCEMNSVSCPETSKCSFQHDISAFGCGCPRSFRRDKSGICVEKEKDE